jgi:hypothetical protein
MANRQIYELTADTPTGTYVIPVQIANGSAEAKKATVAAILDLLPNGAVTLAKLVDASAQNAILMRVSASSGDYEELILAANVSAIVQAADYAAIRTLLGLVIGTNVQAYDAELAALAGLTSAADKGIQFTGSGTAGVYDLTAAGKAILDDADATAQRATLGLTIGTHVQAYDAELAALAGLTSAADKGIQFTGSGTAAVYDLTTAGKALLDDASATAQRATLGMANRVLAQGLNFVPPATNGAAPGTLVGGAGEYSLQGFAFDKTTDESIDGIFRVPTWFPASTGVNVKFCFHSTTTAGGNAVWLAAFRRINTTEDWDTTNHSYSTQTATVAASTTAGAMAYVSIAFSSAQIDSFVAGELVNLRITRDADTNVDADCIVPVASIMVEEA